MGLDTVMRSACAAWQMRAFTDGTEGRLTVDARNRVPEWTFTLLTFSIIGVTPLQESEQAGTFPGRMSMA